MTYLRSRFIFERKNQMSTSIRNVSLAGLILTLVAMGGCLYAPFTGQVIVNNLVHGLVICFCGILAVGFHLSVVFEIDKVESK